jgi:hypothetical protein
MRLVTTIEGSPPEVAAQLGYYLNGLAQANRLIMRRDRIPPLYKAGIPYQVEPWASEFQSLSTCREAIDRKWMECKAAAAWLLAEYREAQPSEEHARRFDIFVDWKERAADPVNRGLVPRDGVVRVYHARVLHPDGRLEDPTRRLRRKKD